MPTVFIVASLLLGDPKLMLEDTVFKDPMACQVFLHQRFDAATIEVFRLECIAKPRGR
jgi:hypothetical protein